MKNFLKNHPIFIAVILGLLTMTVTIIVSVKEGQHYYYNIHKIEDEITDVKVEQLSKDKEQIYLLNVSGIDYGKDSVNIYFDAVNPGEGLLRITYMSHMLNGDSEQKIIEPKLEVSDWKVIYIGKGVYNHNGITAIHWGIGIYSLLMSLYFVWRRKELSKTNRYSYSYISTWSCQLYFLGILLIFVATSIISLVKLNYVDVQFVGTVTNIILLLFAVVSFPLVFIFALVMAISNIALIRHEGKRLSNMLGIGAGIGLIVAVWIMVIFFAVFIMYGDDNATIAVLYSVTNAFYTVFLSVLGGSIISVAIAGQHKPSMDKDYIIILGCAIRKDGTLYPLIQGRVDAAIDFWKKQKKYTGKTAVFVPSGGQGIDEIIPEGEAMKRYLLEQGIDEKYILAETKSTTTSENMRFSKELIDKINPTAKIAFSTTNYHVMRSGILAGQEGVQAEGIGARTKWYFWPNALLREVVGMFAYQPKVEILTMIVLGVVAGLFGYLYYEIM